MPVTSQARICKVGYALNAKKMRKSFPESANIERVKRNWQGGGLSDILETLHEGIAFAPFEYDSTVKSVEAFDVIIHKLTEDLDSTEQESILKVRAIDEYLLQHPSTVIIDPFPAVHKVISRARTCLTLQRLIDSTSKCPFSQPKFAIAESPAVIADFIRTSGLRYPVICKPIEACGTPSSHSMVVAINEDGLSLVKCPCVVQEYMNHDGLFYKVYVIDKKVMVFQRPSLPNLLISPPTTAASGSAPVPAAASRSLSFDSRYSYPTAEDFYCDSAEEIDSSISSSVIIGGTCIISSDAEAVLKSSPTSSTRSKRKADISIPLSEVLPLELAAMQEKFDTAASVISSGFGLTLFGFDVMIPVSDHCSTHASTVEGRIIDSLSRQLFIIDVNFFPSYKEVRDFPDQLCSYLRKRAGF